MSLSPSNLFQPAAALWNCAIVLSDSQFVFYQSLAVVFYQSISIFYLRIFILIPCTLRARLKSLHRSMRIRIPRCTRFLRIHVYQQERKVLQYCSKISSLSVQGKILNLINFALKDLLAIIFRSYPLY